MHYRILGKTGLRVSALGFGGSALGGVFQPVEPADACRAVRAGLDLGINFFDTAPYYAATRAEAVLGQALAGVPRSNYVLATKVGRYGPELKDFDFSADRTTRSVDESLRRLGVDHVDVLQAHDIEFGDIQQVIHETIPALVRLRDAGKTRFIGVTGLHLHLLAGVLAEASVDVVQSYCHYTLADQTLSRWTPDFTAKQVGIISSAPLAMRLLTDEGPPSWHPAPAALKARCADAAAYCRQRGRRLAELALQFSIRAPDVHTTVVSATAEDCVKRNVAVLDEPLDPQLLADVQRILAPVHNLSWPSGRPENQPPCA